MPVVQEAFFVPDEIAIGLTTKLYSRYGSVVRYANGPKKGQIVKHLKPYSIKATEDAKSKGKRAFQIIKQSKKGTIIALTSTAAFGTGILVYNKIKHHKKKLIEEFNTAFSEYFDAIRTGNMDIEKINKLIETLEQLKKYIYYKRINIKFTADELEIFVKYTIKLAQDNQVVLSEDELNSTKNMKSGTIIILQKYLNAQKKIFEDAG